MGAEHRRERGEVLLGVAHAERQVFHDHGLATVREDRRHGFQDAQKGDRHVEWTGDLIRKGMMLSAIGEPSRGKSARLYMPISHRV